MVKNIKDKASLQNTIAAFKPDEKSEKFKLKEMEKILN